MKTNEENEIKYNQPKKWIQYLVLSSCSFIGIGLVLSTIVRIDEVITSRGKIENTGSIKLIKSNIEGNILYIKFEEGQRVKKDTLLIKFEDNIYVYQEEILKNKIKELENAKTINKELLEKYISLKNEGAISELNIYNVKEKINQINSDIRQARIKLNENKYKKSKTLIKSPVTGRIFESKKLNKDYFAQNGELLLKLIPDTLLEAKVFIPNSQIGLLRENMKVDVRVDAFPFTTYGDVKGKIKSIAEESKTISQNDPNFYFETIISLEKQFIEKDNKKYFLKAGESISANIKIKNRPIIFVVSDIFKTTWDKIKTIRSSS